MVMMGGQDLEEIPPSPPRDEIEQFNTQQQQANETGRGLTIEYEGEVPRVQEM